MSWSPSRETRSVLERSRSTKLLDRQRAWKVRRSVRRACTRLIALAAPDPDRVERDRLRPRGFGLPGSRLESGDLRATATADEHEPGFSRIRPGWIRRRAPRNRMASSSTRWIRDYGAPSDARKASWTRPPLGTASILTSPMNVTAKSFGWFVVNVHPVQVDLDGSGGTPRRPRACGDVVHLRTRRSRSLRCVRREPRLGPALIG